MSQMKIAGQLTDDRTRIILTYAVCGFSNIVSIGIQVGGLGAMAPGKRTELALSTHTAHGHSFHCVIVLPGQQHLRDVAHHGQRQGVQCLGAVECDQTYVSIDLRQHIAAWQFNM
jgi:hypothetical protein